MKISVQRYRATGSLRNSLRKKLVSSRSLIPVLLLGSLILLACVHIWQRVYVMGLVQEVTVLENENRCLKDLVKKTDMEIIDLSRLSRIEQLATRELGLSRKGSEDLYLLSLNDAETESEGFDEVVTSLKKIADNFPVLSESKAETIDIFELNEE